VSLLALTSLYAGSAGLTTVELPVVRAGTDLLLTGRYITWAAVAAPARRSFEVVPAPWSRWPPVVSAAEPEDFCVPAVLEEDIECSCAREPVEHHAHL
jgi:hypothetical protein